MKPAEIPNFESAARRLRYQALGQACREKQIWSLLLAHHNDDQAETVFLRLAGGHSGVGLKGMSSSAEIPECWGLHGVHQSGILPEVSFLKVVNDLDGSHSNQEKPHNNLNDRKRKTKSTIDFEDGGIRIYRPLLNFSKNRLQATCLHFQIPWVEDKTNQDASKTPRNAVRQLLNSGNLPKALQKPSLLAVAERTRYESVKRISDVEIWFHKTQTLVFDVRSGVMIVRMPARLMPTKRNSEAYPITGLAHTKFRAGLFLRRLLECVSPEESISIRQLGFAINSIFSDLDDPEATAIDKRLQPSNFTAASVQMQRVEFSIEDSDENETSRNQLDPDFIWIFNRQPSSHNPSLLIPVRPPSHTDPALPSPPYSSRPFSPWQLFDGRYWIRVSHSSPHPLQIRFPEPADMQALHVAFHHSLRQRLDLKGRLNGAAPGKIRFTLPVIAEAGKGGRMLAIPTLGIVLPDAMGLWWEVRYKKVNWGSKGLTGEA